MTIDFFAIGKNGDEPEKEEDRAEVLRDCRDVYKFYAMAMDWLIEDHDVLHKNTQIFCLGDGEYRKQCNHCGAYLYPSPSKNYS